jgi:hypothetical protein
MAKPGPKPGFKKAPQPEQAQTASAEGAGPSPIPSHEPVLSAQDRENPTKLTGEALRTLAHRRGLSRSELDRLSDEKIREQLRFVTHRQYEADDAVV